MLKKLFVITVFGMSNIFSGDPKSDKESAVITFLGQNGVILEHGKIFISTSYIESDLLSERVEHLKNKCDKDVKEKYDEYSNFRYRGDHILWEILAQHQKIDGRKFNEFFEETLGNCLEDNGEYRYLFYSDHPAYSKDNMLRLCTLRQRPDWTKLLAPSWDDVAIEPIFSQYQTVASSDLSLKHSINFLKIILIFDRQIAINRKKYSDTEYYFYRRVVIDTEYCCTKHYKGTSYHIKTATGQKLIQANWSDIPDSLTSPAESLLINDTLDAETRDKLSKSGLFVAQIYTELLKKRPREVDGVRIIYLSEPEEVDEVKISYPSGSTQESSCCSIQ